ncbi:beta-ketoacyl synthase N-terminal-like domain-containing protein [Pseudoduganella sp. HUAS MS19]
MDTPVYIVAHGARTPLGLHAASSAAAYRAAISGMSVHPYLVDQAGEPMPAALDSCLHPELIGPERFQALAEHALLEACAPLTAEGAGLHHELPLFLGLPEIRPGFAPGDAQVVKTGLSQLSMAGGRLAGLSPIHIALHGHAAGLAALISAAARIRDGSLEMCLAGGIDSYLHPETMEWLDGNRQLMGTVSRSGFVPGEAAGFCLLMGAARCQQLGLRPLATVWRGGLAEEARLIKTSELCLGEGLTAAVRTALAGMPEAGGRVDAIYLDQNGQRYRGEEWGFVCLRLGQHFSDPTAYQSPADCWGDVGAASGPLFASLACQAAQRGYAAGRVSLLCCSSEGGMRGALLLSTSDPTEH